MQTIFLPFKFYDWVKFRPCTLNNHDYSFIIDFHEIIRKNFAIKLLLTIYKEL